MNVKASDLKRLAFGLLLIGGGQQVLESAMTQCYNS
jgi:hypothetical protein